MGSGAITVDTSPGPGAPPDILGPYVVEPFGTDPGANQTPASSVPDPATGASVGLSPQTTRLRIGAGWATWSNDYAGMVYSTQGDQETITPPSGTEAFYFYAEPDPFQPITITATAQDGTSSGPIVVNGRCGAQYFGFYTDGSVPLSSITITSTADFAIGEFGMRSTFNATNAAADYVALGDSFSSGEGNSPFLNGTDGNGDFCHRSQAAYPYVVAPFAHLPLSFYACSGARTSDLYATKDYGEVPQVTHPQLNSHTKLVTLTIGGNDVDFSGSLAHCMWTDVWASAKNLLTYGAAGADTSCADDSTFVQREQQRINDLENPASGCGQFSPLCEAYQAVERRAPNAIVATGDYPHIFSTTHACLGHLLTLKDQVLFDQDTDKVDSQIYAAATQAQTQFVEARSAFSGHELCGPSSWFNGPDLHINLLGLLTNPTPSNVYNELKNAANGSFHPNANGQKDGYAIAFENALFNEIQHGRLRRVHHASARARQPAARTADTAPAGPDYGSAGVEEVQSTPATLHYGVTPGEQVQVTGSGFAPGATVSLSLGTLGAGARPDNDFTVPLQPAADSLGNADSTQGTAASTVADTSGNVSTIVTLPAGTYGFPIALGESVAFINVTGQSADTTATEQEDTAMIQVAELSNPCSPWFDEELPW